MPVHHNVMLNSVIGQLFEVDIDLTHALGMQVDMTPKSEVIALEWRKAFKWGVELEYERLGVENRL